MVPKNHKKAPSWTYGAYTYEKPKPKYNVAMDTLLTMVKNDAIFNQMWDKKHNFVPEKVTSPDIMTTEELEKLLDEIVKDKEALKAAMTDEEQALLDEDMADEAAKNAYAAELEAWFDDG